MQIENSLREPPIADQFGAMPIPVARAQTSSSEFGDALMGMWLATVAYLAAVAVLILAFSLWGGVSGIGQILVGVLICVVSILILSTMLVALVVAPLGTIALLLSSMLFRTLRSNVQWPTVAAFAGGLTGFVCTAVVFAADPGRPDWYAFAVLIGPVAATLFGQVGTAWTTIGPGIPGCRPVVEESQEQDHPPVRFDIRQLMAATAWMAAVLTVLKLAGLLTGTGLAIVCGWLVFQAVTLMVVLHVVRTVRGHGEYTETVTAANNTP